MDVGDLPGESDGIVVIEVVADRGQEREDVLAAGRGERGRAGAAHRHLGPGRDLDGAHVGVADKGAGREKWRRGRLEAAEYVSVTNAGVGVCQERRSQAVDLFPERLPLRVCHG